MPLTPKGEKIKAAMVREYGPEKGEQVFHASRNAGKISGVDQGRQSTQGHYLRVGGAKPDSRITGKQTIPIPGVDVRNGSGESFVPGGRRR